MTSTVLLIDDNAVQAATRQTILKRAGYFVIAVLSPERALEQFRNQEFPSQIDLIITDHIMPGMNGSEFVRRVREFDSEVPVLVISGMEGAEPEYASLDIHFRIKPLMPDNLLASVHRLIRRRAENDAATEPAATTASPTETKAVPDQSGSILPEPEPST